MKSALLLTAAYAALVVPSALAGVSSVSPPEKDAWEKFNDWSIGGLLFPNVHLHGIGGYSSGDLEDLASGPHDPRREAFSGQAIEPGISLRTKYVEGFANYFFYQDEEGDWDGELEEAFGKIINLPGGFELKGGQFLSRFGAMNDRHLHAWDFVDADLATTRFLGEHGLFIRGAEASWTLPLGMDPGFVTVASLGYGEMRPESHAHEHGGDHGEEPEYEGEDGILEDNIWTARLMGRYRFSDFHSLTGGISWAGGDNRFGRSTDVAGLDLEYLWRERGLEPGGRALRWRNEFLWRRVEALGGGHEEHGEHADHEEEEDHEEDHGESLQGTFEESGLFSSVVYTWNEHLDTGIRVGWVEGIDAFGQEERLRVSPNVSWWFDSGRRVGARIQYDYDQIKRAEDEHSIWFQVNIALGSIGEVR